MAQYKFMQSLEQEVYDQIAKTAKDRGITVQELIRAVIIPDWLQSKNTMSPNTALTATERLEKKSISLRDFLEQNKNYIQSQKQTQQGLKVLIKKSAISRNGSLDTLREIKKSALAAGGEFIITTEGVLIKFSAE